MVDLGSKAGKSCYSTCSLSHPTVIPLHINHLLYLLYCIARLCQQLPTTLSKISWTNTIFHMESLLWSLLIKFKVLSVLQSLLFISLLLKPTQNLFQLKISVCHSNCSSHFFRLLTLPKTLYLPPFWETFYPLFYDSPFRKSSPINYKRMGKLHLIRDSVFNFITYPTESNNVYHHWYAILLLYWHDHPNQNWKELKSDSWEVQLNNN